MKKRIFLTTLALLLTTGCSPVSEPFEDDSEALQPTSRSQYEDEKFAPAIISDDTTYDEWNEQLKEQKIKYADMLPSEYEDGIPDEMIYGVMTDIDHLMISHMTYYNTDEHKRGIYMLSATQNAKN